MTNKTSTSTNLHHALHYLPFVVSESACNHRYIRQKRKYQLFVVLFIYLTFWYEIIFRIMLPITYIHIYQFVFQRNICILFKPGHIKHISFYNKAVFAVTKFQQSTFVELHFRTLLLLPLIRFDLCRFSRKYIFQIGWEWWEKERNVQFYGNYRTR